MIFYENQAEESQGESLFYGESPSNGPETKARMDILKEHAEAFLAAKADIDTGFTIQERSGAAKHRMIELFGASEDDWNDWRWQLANRITDTDTLAAIIELDDIETSQINRVGRSYRWAISPYYASLMSPIDHMDPVRRQSVPSILELTDESGVDDPSCEEKSSPVDIVVRRYPDRLIINLTNQCAMFCRHCQRRRNIGQIDRHARREQLVRALDYIRLHAEIRDVVITGGDPFMLSDQTIEWLLGELDSIDHVEIKRIGTRTLVTMPQRITDDLCAIIEKYPPVYINTQFNSPQEITPQAREAASKLVKAGAIINNQAVLLEGINNDPFVMKVLNQQLLKSRIRPYYIFQAKPVRGISHFITPIEDGLAILRSLQCFTSGLAMPQYIVSAPGGLGKVPINDLHWWKSDSGNIYLRTWEGKTVKYPI